MPLAFVPMKFPATRFPVAAPVLILMPPLLLPAIRLRAPAVVPPIVLLAPRTTMPPPAFGRASVPVGSVPMKLLSMVLPADGMNSPACAKRLMARPRMMLLPPFSARPLTLPDVVPSISMSGVPA